MRIKPIAIGIDVGSDHTEKRQCRGWLGDRCFVGRAGAGVKSWQTLPRCRVARSFRRLELVALARLRGPRQHQVRSIHGDALDRKDVIAREGIGASLAFLVIGAAIAIQVVGGRENSGTVLGFPNVTEAVGVEV